MQNIRIHNNANVNHVSNVFHLRLNRLKQYKHEGRTMENTADNTHLKNSGNID